MPSATTAAAMGSLSRARHSARRVAPDAWLTRRDRSRLRFSSSHECADELAVDGGDRLGTESGPGEKLTGALGCVHPRWLQVDILEPGLGELRAILGLFECTGDAADPQLDAATNLGRHLAAHDHVGDGEPSPRLQDAKCLG